MTHADRLRSLQRKLRPTAPFTLGVIKNAWYHKKVKTGKYNAIRKAFHENLDNKTRADEAQ
jgi:hypothetical protein